MNKNIIVLLILIITFSSSGELYRVFVDKEFGFFGVRSHENYNITYNNHTLYINKNDTVEWENFAQNNERIWIISDNKLWNNSDAILGSNFKLFNHTFNKKGKYRVHIEGVSYIFPNISVSQDKNASKYDKTPQRDSYSKYQIIVVSDSITSDSLSDDNVSNKGIISQIETKVKKIIKVKPKIEEEIPYEEVDSAEPEPIVTSTPTKPLISPLFSPDYQKLTIFEILKKLLNK